MKKCPFCAEEIQDAAIVCRYCQRDLTTQSPVAPVTAQPPSPPETPAVPSSVSTPAKKKTSPAAWGCLTVLVLCFLFVGWCVSLMPDTSSSARRSTSSSASTSPPQESGPRATPPPAPTAKLALLSARGYDEYGYHIVEGQVRNISGESLKSVAVKATWYDKDDQFITSDDALIDYNPILPGQTSPFKTMTRTNPAMSKYSVEFKYLFGGVIATDDLRKK